MKTLPIEQMDSFLREARDSGVFEMYYVELATGLRRGQLLGLKWEDIDFEHDNLQVKRQIARINDEIVKAHRKSKNAYRTLPQAEDTIQVLKRAGLPRVRFHDLRHTFATLAFQNGVDTKVVSGILGYFSAGSPWRLMPMSQ